VHQPAHEVLGLVEAEQFVHDQAVEQTKLAGPLGELYAGEPGEQAVEPARGDALDESGLDRIRAARVYDAESIPPALDELGNERRRVLQVGIHDDDGVAAREAESRHDRGLLSEAAGEMEAAHPRVTLGQAHDPGPAVVVAVVDEEELVIQSGRGAHFVEGRRERSRVHALVVAGHDDGDQSRAGAATRRDAQRTAGRCGVEHPIRHAASSR
jgi:hypothetical protein